MKKVIVMSIVCISGITAITVWPYMKMEFASSAHYTEQDKREYEYYTPELLKEIPRISKDYEFSYSNISGPQAFVYSVQFNGTTNTSQIHDYLVSKGYVSQNTCDTAAECWRSPHSKDVVSFYGLEKLNLVSVEIYRRDYAN